jgi:hypothetical protein
LSDKEGKYRFINLKPGQYQVRCYTGKYLYFGQKASAMEGTILYVKDGASLKNIDFRFAQFKKGTWKTYTHLDGLASNYVHAIHFPPQITQGESLIQEILSERIGLPAAMERLQRRLIENALRECDGNHTQAAKMLGLQRSNFIRLMRRLGIDYNSLLFSHLNNPLPPSASV